MSLMMMRLSSGVARRPALLQKRPVGGGVSACAGSIPESASTARTHKFLEPGRKSAPAPGDDSAPWASPRRLKSSASRSRQRHVRGSSGGHHACWAGHGRQRFLVTAKIPAPTLGRSHSRPVISCLGKIQRGTTARSPRRWSRDPAAKPIGERSAWFGCWPSRITSMTNLKT
jgi:hypothetical protein